MRKICLLAAALCVAGNVCADPLRVRCTAPTHNNTGTCSAPVLNSAAGTDSLWVIFTVVPVPPTNASARRDSVWRRPGGSIDITYNMPRGNYTITALPGRKRSNGKMAYGCPSQIVGATAVTVPYRPAFVE